MAVEIRDILTIIKKDIIKGNISKRLRKRIRSISNGYSRIKIFVRPKKNKKDTNRRVSKSRYPIINNIFRR